MINEMGKKQTQKELDKNAIKLFEKVLLVGAFFFRLITSSDVLPFISNLAHTKNEYDSISQIPFDSEIRPY